jgi:type IX secretion system PorP/SprF family membrane protein
MGNILKRSKSTIIIICFTHLLLAQDLGLYRNYLIDNFYHINPAAAGYDGPFYSQLTVSKRWLGINDSPSTQVLSNSLRLGMEEFYNPNMFLNRPVINIAKRVGIGFSIYNEINGPLRHTGILLAYAYHLPIHNGHFSFGISGLISQYKLNTNEFKPVEEADPILYTRNSAIVPDANIGIMLYKQNFFSGITANGLFNFNRIMDHTSHFPDIVAIGGYRFNTNMNFKVEPSLFICRDAKGSFSADVNTKFYFYDKYWLLLSYKSKGELMTAISLNIKSGFQVLYSYSINTTGLASYYQGSHCISLRVNIASFIKNT